MNQILFLGNSPFFYPLPSDGMDGWVITPFCGSEGTVLEFYWDWKKTRQKTCTFTFNWKDKRRPKRRAGLRKQPWPGPFRRARQWAWGIWNSAQNSPEQWTTDSAHLRTTQKCIAWSGSLCSKVQLLHKSEEMKSVPPGTWPWPRDCHH